MDSIISASLTEICSQGINGLPLKDLWPKLLPSLTSSNLPLSPSIKSLIYSLLLKIPNLQFNSPTSSITKIQSLESAEKLNLTITAHNQLLDCFYGLHDHSSSISDSQRKVLDLLGVSRTKGISQCEIAKEIGLGLNKMEYVLKPLEIRGLIVRQSAIVRRNGGQVSTNLVYLACYAKKLSYQQRLEVNLDSLGNGSECSKEDVVVNDYVPAMKAVCDKLEEAEGKVLPALEIKRALGYKGQEGFRAWRNIHKRLKDAGLVEENGKCLRLLKRFDTDGVGENADDLDVEDSLETGQRNKNLDVVLELPIEHQIYDMIDKEGRKGITVVEFCKRLGLSSKRIYIFLRGMVLRSEIHIQAESHNKSMQYRVWTTPNFVNDGSSNVVHGKPENLPSARRASDNSPGIGCNEEHDLWKTVSGTASPQSEMTPPAPSPVKHGSVLKYPSPGETAESVQREQFILEQLLKEKFILFSELYRRIVSLEKDKHTTMDKKTLKRKLSKLEQGGHCKRIQVTSPNVTNCSRSGIKTVVLNKSLKGSLTPELLGHIYEEVRSSDSKRRQRGLTQVKNKKVVSGSNSVNASLERRNSYSKAVSAEAIRANGFIIAKMARARLLHTFLFDYLRSSPDRDDGLSSESHGNDLKNLHGTCRILEMGMAIKAMPIKLFLQVVGSVQKFEECKLGLTLSELSSQDYDSLMDYLANKRLTSVVDYLRQLKLMQLVTDSKTEDQDQSLLAILTYTMELKPFIEEPLSRVSLSLGTSSRETRATIRHDFVLSSKDDVDAYWSTLEKCAAINRPKAKVHAVQGSSVQKVDDVSNADDSCIHKCQAYPNQYRDIQSIPQKRKKSLKEGSSKHLRSEEKSVIRKRKKSSKAGSSKRLRSEGRSFCMTDSEDHEIRLHSCEENGDANAERIPSTNTHKVPQKHDERGKQISIRGVFSGISSKLVNEGMNDSTLAYESLAVANAVELLKLVLLSTSSAPKVQNLLEETLMQYSEHDLFAAFSYLKEKNLVAGGEGSQTPALSRQFLHNLSSSLFPVNTSKRTAKFISCLRERENDLMEDEIHLDDDLQCGDLFHLLALIYSGSLFISPSLPNEGIGEGEVDFNLKRKTYDEKSYTARTGKRMKYPDKGEVIYRRAEAFPGIKVSVSLSPVSDVCGVEVVQNGSLLQPVAEIKDDMGVSNSMSRSNDSEPKEAAADRSPWQPMARYGEQLLSKFPDIEQRSLFPELFRSTYSDIYKAGDQGLSMEQISHALGSQGMPGERMAEIVVDVLQAFGKSIKVNAFNDVHVVDASFRSKYLLTLSEGHNQGLESAHSYKPILPWINGDGTVNQIVYKRLVRRVLGIVMQNPGMLEDAVVSHMDVLNPQSCRKLLELMILDNHLTVRKVDQIIGSSPPSLFSPKIKLNSVCRKHFYAHPMSTTLL
ncbi:hypothetical protein ACHQM5_005161 [Ranunculus cassubicifolius]